MFWQLHMTLPDWIMMDIVQLLFPEMLIEQTLRMPAGLPNLPVTVGRPARSEDRRDQSNFVVPF